MFSLFFFFLMIRRPPRSTLDRSSAASDVYKRQTINLGANANFKNDTVKIENYFVAEVCCRQDKNMASKKIGLSPNEAVKPCLLYTSPSPRDRTRSRMPSSA